jgi:phasin family protein
MNTQRDSAATAAGNPILTLSTLYWRSVEDIAALNLNAARAAFDDCASVGRALSAPMAGKDYAQCLSALGQPMFDKAVTHSRDLCNVMAKTQQEMTTAMKAQLAFPPMAWPGSGDWSELSGMFSKGFEQLTARAMENVNATTEASNKAVAAATLAARKAA